MQTKFTPSFSLKKNLVLKTIRVLSSRSIAELCEYFRSLNEQEIHLLITPWSLNEDGVEGYVSRTGWLLTDVILVHYECLLQALRALNTPFLSNTSLSVEEKKDLIHQRLIGTLFRNIVNKNAVRFYSNHPENNTSILFWFGTHEKLIEILLYFYEKNDRLFSCSKTIFMSSGALFNLCQIEQASLKNTSLFYQLILRTLGRKLLGIFIKENSCIFWSMKPETLFTIVPAFNISLFYILLSINETKELYDFIWEYHHFLFEKITPEALFTRSNFEQKSVFGELLKWNRTEVFDLLLRKNPAIFTYISLDILEQRLSDGATILFHLSKTEIFYKILKVLLKENPMIFAKISPDALLEDNLYYGVSTLFFLAIKSEINILKEIFKNNELLINKITSEILFKFHYYKVKDHGSHHRSIFQTLCLSEEGIHLLYELLQKKPALLENIPEKVMFQTISHQNKSAFDILGHHKKGKQLLDMISSNGSICSISDAYEKQVVFISMLQDPSNLFLHRDAESLGLKELYLNTCFIMRKKADHAQLRLYLKLLSEEGIDFLLTPYLVSTLKDLKKTNSIILNVDTGWLFIDILFAQDGHLLKIILEAFQSTSETSLEKEAKTKLKTLLLGFMKHKAEKFTRIHPHNNTSLLFWLATHPIGMKIIFYLNQINHVIFSHIDAKTLYEKPSKGGLSLFQLMGRSCKTQQLLCALLKDHQNLLQSMTLDHLFSQDSFYGKSAFYWFAGSEALMSFLLQNHPTLAEAIRVEHLCEFLLDTRESTLLRLSIHKEGFTLNYLGQKNSSIWKGITLRTLYQANIVRNISAFARLALSDAHSHILKAILLCNPKLIKKLKPETLYQRDNQTQLSAFDALTKSAKNMAILELLMVNNTNIRRSVFHFLHNIVLHSPKEQEHVLFNWKRYGGIQLLQKFSGIENLVNELLDELEKFSLRQPNMRAPRTFKLFAPLLLNSTIEQKQSNLYFNVLL